MLSRLVHSVGFRQKLTLTARSRNFVTVSDGTVKNGLGYEVKEGSSIRPGMKLLSAFHKYV